MITLPEDSILAAHDAKQKSPVELAFVGDAVYETLVREHISLHHDAPASQLHKLAVTYVRAEAQQKAFESISQMLSEEEMTVFKRGRNANKVTASKNADITAYRTSTGVEALFGFLYLTGENERIRELFSKIVENTENAAPQQ